MDNIVDYLIAGFFIISFLSSLFKKKKAKENPNKDIEKVPANSQQEVKERKQKGKNPFEEFFKVINEELDNAKKDISHSEVDEYYEKAFQKSDNAKIADQETSHYSQPDSVPELSRAAKESTISIESYSDSVQDTKEKHESRKAKEISTRLSKKDSIREFIIMNEILGKPKALQR